MMLHLLVRMLTAVSLQADQKEMTMDPIRDFNRHNILPMMEYLRAVSTEKNGLYSDQRLESREDRYLLINLERHKKTLSSLERESVSEPPYYIDSSRELAIITSAVVRHSRNVNKKAPVRKLDDSAVGRLRDACSKVEAETLQRVNELTTRLAQERRRAPALTTSIEQLLKSFSLSSITTSKSPLPLASKAPFLALGPDPELACKSDETPISGSRAPGHTSGQKPDVISPDSQENDIAKLRQSESLLDDVAKRKKSFMRGFFGGL